MADLVESIGALSAPPPPRTSLRAVSRDTALRAGRTCYRHLAGELGLAITDALRDLDVVTPTWTLGSAGSAWFAELGIDVEEPSRQPLLRPCLDWTERRDHLAGRLGDALCTALTDRGWIRKRPGARAVTLTAAGRDELAERGIDGLAGP